MSTGPGRVQRHILDTLTASDVRLWPVAAIADQYAAELDDGQYAGPDGQRQLRFAFRRGANKLVAVGLVNAWHVQLGRGPKVLCVSLPAADKLTEDLRAGATELMESTRARR